MFAVAAAATQNAARLKKVLAVKNLRTLLLYFAIEKKEDCKYESWCNKRLLQEAER